MAAGIKSPKTLQVRSDTLVGRSGPAVTTEPGTKDRIEMPSIDTADTMPQAKGYFDKPENRGEPRIVSQTFSWKALQGADAPTPSEGMMAGAGTIGDHTPMPGVVQKNKAPF